MTVVETDSSLSVTRISTKSLSDILNQVKNLEGDLYYLSIHYNDSNESFSGGLAFKPRKEVKRKE